MDPAKLRADYWNRKLRGICVMAGCKRRATKSVRCNRCQTRYNEQRRTKRANAKALTARSNPVVIKELYRKPILLSPVKPFTYKDT